MYLDDPTSDLTATLQFSTTETAAVLEGPVTYTPTQKVETVTVSGISHARSRAVGTAIGSNPVAYLVPCHRVITSSGNLGGYHWGIDRKSALIGWEAAQINGVER